MKFLKYFVILLALVTFGCRNQSALNARNMLRNSQTPFSQEAFLDSIVDGDTEKVDLFMKAGIDTEIGQHNSNALIVAVQNKQLEIVKKLVRNGAQLDPDGYAGTPLCVAAAKGYNDIAKYLIRKGACIDYLRGDINPLMVAAAAGHPEMVKILIKADADVNIAGESTSYTPLMQACRNGHLETVKALLSKKGNIWILQKATRLQNTNYGSSTALDMAIFKGYDKIANALINDSRFQPAKAESALVMAMAMNRQKVIDELIKKKVDINAEFVSMPLLSWAITNEHFIGAAALIKAGADIKREDKLEMIPLDHAITVKSKIHRKLKQIDSDLDYLLSSKTTQAKKELNEQEIDSDPAVVNAKAQKAALDKAADQIEGIINSLQNPASKS